MSDIKLIQRIRETAQALQNAKDVDDAETVETLEDLLYDLEEELAEQQKNEYETNRCHGWY